MKPLKDKPLLRWGKDGIYLLQGPLKGYNLNKIYKQDDAVIEMLEDIYYDMDQYNKKAIKEAIEDLRAM